MLNLYKYYSKYIADLKKRLKAVTDSFDEDNIHDLRVDIKKIHALFHLLELANPDEFKRAYYYSLFKPVFKNAGSLRQNQLNLSLMKDYTKDKKIIALYKEHLRKSNKKKKKNLEENIAKLSPSLIKTINKEVKKNCAGFDDKELNHYILKFNTSENTRIRHLQKRGADPEIVHEIRKHLKLLMYILPLLEKLRSDINIDTLIANLKETESSIGDWHDRIIFNASVNEFLNVTGSELNLKDLQRLRKKTENNSLELKNTDLAIPVKMDIIAGELKKIAAAHKSLK